MQISVTYVVAIVAALAAAVAVLFKLYVKSQNDLLAEKEEKVRILVELKRLLEQRKRKRGDHGPI